MSNQLFEDPNKSQRDFLSKVLTDGLGLNPTFDFMASAEHLDTETNTFTKTFIIDYPADLGNATAQNYARLEEALRQKFQGKLTGVDIASDTDK